jgi:hypothetical protein
MELINTHGIPMINVDTVLHQLCGKFFKKKLSIKTLASLMRALLFQCSPNASKHYLRLILLISKN